MTILSGSQANPKKHLQIYKHILKCVSKHEKTFDLKLGQNSPINSHYNFFLEVEETA
jgi:hypothetical protein